MPGTSTDEADELELETVLETLAAEAEADVADDDEDDMGELLNLLHGVFT
jgi:hypothetical protein